MISDPASEPATLPSFWPTLGKLWRLSQLAVASLVLAGPVSTADADSFTAPGGVIGITLTQGTTTAIGVPLLDALAFHGTVSSLTSTSLLPATAEWIDSQFAQTGSPYFATILSGAQAGRLLQVIANTATTVTFNVDDTNLDAAGFAVASGDHFEIFKGNTLSSLFGDSTANLILQGGSQFTSDTVQVHNGIRYLSYYFDTSKDVWLKVGGDGTSQNGLVLAPDRGLLVGRRGPTATFTFTGRVPTVALLTRLPGGTTNAVSIRYPLDTTLGNLSFSGPGTWMSNDSAFLADTVNLFNGIRWTAYWKRASDGQWRKFNGDNSDQSNLVIAAGTSILVQKRGTGTGVTAFFSQLLPYVLQ